MRLFLLISLIFVFAITPASTAQNFYLSEEKRLEYFICLYEVVQANYLFCGGKRGL